MWYCNNGCLTDKCFRFVFQEPPKTKPHVHRVLSAPPAPCAPHTAGKDTLTPDRMRMDARSEYQAMDIGNDVETQQILTSVITHTELLHTHTLKATITQEQTHIEAQPRIVGRIVGKTYTELRRPSNYTPKQAESRILAQKEGDKEISRYIALKHALDLCHNL